MTRLALIFAGLSAFSSAPAFGSYADCILENMKGVSSDAAAKAIERACELKWNAEEAPPSTGQSVNSDQGSDTLEQQANTDKPKTNPNQQETESAPSASLPSTDTSIDAMPEPQDLTEENKDSLETIAQPEKGIDQKAMNGFCPTKDRIWPRAAGATANRVYRVNKNLIGCKSRPLSAELLCLRWGADQIGNKEKFAVVAFQNDEELAELRGYWKVFRAKSNLRPDPICGDLYNYL